jgi:hypothetical protein
MQSVTVRKLATKKSSHSIYDSTTTQFTMPHITRTQLAAAFGQALQESAESGVERQGHTQGGWVKQR